MQSANDSHDSKTGPVAGPRCALPTGNLQPLLYEIRHALARWIETGAEHVIDLRCLPLSPAEESRLLHRLGRGEVSARLAALGESEIHETAVSGVWLVNHFNQAGDPVGRFIEICACPGILVTQGDDARDALTALDAMLEGTGEGQNE